MRKMTPSATRSSGEPDPLSGGRAVVVRPARPLTRASRTPATAPGRRARTRQSGDGEEDHRGGDEQRGDDAHRRRRARRRRAAPPPTRPRRECSRGRRRRLAAPEDEVRHGRVVAPTTCRSARCRAAGAPPGRRPEVPVATATMPQAVASSVRMTVRTIPTRSATRAAARTCPRRPREEDGEGHAEPGDREPLGQQEERQEGQERRAGRRVDHADRRQRLEAARVSDAPASAARASAPPWLRRLCPPRSGPARGR